MNEIVVGIDGSDESARALRWAVGRARLTGQPVRTVYAYTLPPIDAEDDPPSLGTQQAAERILSGAVDGVLGDRQDVKVLREARPVRRDSIAKALVESARDASLLVIGSRGLGGFTGLLLGSVSQQCVTYAPCPVVVVREEPAGE